LEFIVTAQLACQKEYGRGRLGQEPLYLIDPF